MPTKPTPTFGFSEQSLEAMVCRDSLYEFVKAAWVHIEPALFIDSWHIKAICEHLQAVSEGAIEKLLVNIPPGCSKSLLTCVFWPMWEWTRDPSIRWFFASYDQRLSTRDSVRCRTLLESLWYKSICAKPFTLANDQNQKQYYETSFGGYRMATSVGGHSMGEHPHRIVVDDPHRADQAESDVERQSVIDWRDLTMSTRGVTLGVRWVVIMQRLHEEDFSGHVLKDGDWVHICLPMRFEKGRGTTTPLGFSDPRTVDGELLSPKQFDEAKVAQMEKPLGPYGIAGQLQQRPGPRGGGLFKSDFFSTNRVKAAPYDATRVIYWDLAHVGSKSACRTVGTVVHEKAGEFYIGPVWMGQWEPFERDNQIVSAAQYGRDRWGPSYEPTTVIEEEPAAGKDLCRAIIRRLAGFKARADKVRRSKIDRADSYASQAAAGAVHLVDDGSWDILSWIKEHTAFPNGSFLDQVDSAGGGINWLAKNRGNQRAGQFRILNTPGYGAKKKPPLRFMFCPIDHLEYVRVEEKALLVTVRNPSPKMEVKGVLHSVSANGSVSSNGDGHKPIEVAHGLSDAVATVDLEFIAADPSALQDRWGDLMVEYGMLPELAVMRPEHGKKFWAQLMRWKDKVEAVVIADDDDGHRAKSMAYACADALGFSRAETVFDLEEPEWIGKDEPPPCVHVHKQTKNSRNSVM